MSSWVVEGEGCNVSVNVRLQPPSLHASGRHTGTCISGLVQQLHDNLLKCCWQKKVVVWGRTPEMITWNSGQSRRKASPSHLDGLVLSGRTCTLGITNLPMLRLHPNTPLTIHFLPLHFRTPLSKPCFIEIHYRAQAGREQYIVAVRGFLRHNQPAALTWCVACRSCCLVSTS
jgi:hypothetical protein